MIRMIENVCCEVLLELEMLFDVFIEK